MNNTDNLLNILLKDVKPKFKSLIQRESKKEYFNNLLKTLRIELDNYTIYPKIDDIFNVFKSKDIDDIKVVILGQDPYHGENEANGLAFSVNENVKIPPSLKNILKEVNRDMKDDIERPKNLSYLSKQGVFLLNTVLTVRKDTPLSHKNIGWETFTDKIINEISNQTTNIVFMLWGKKAEQKTTFIDGSKHLILKTTHPSPFSARKGFEGCSHFSKANLYLKSKNLIPIKW